MLENTPESPLDCKEIQPVHPKGNQPWVFSGRTYAEAETPLLWPPDAKSWLIRKDPDAGEDWRQKKATENEMVGWHHWFNGNGFEQAPGDGERQESLACCSSWGHKGSDTTDRLNNNNNNIHISVLPDIRIPEREERRLPKQCNSQKKGSLLPKFIRYA